MDLPSLDVLGDSHTPPVAGDGGFLGRHDVDQVNIVLEGVGRDDVSSPPRGHGQKLLHHVVTACVDLHAAVTAEDGDGIVRRDLGARQILAALQLEAVVGVEDDAEGGPGGVFLPVVTKLALDSDGDAGRRLPGSHHKLLQAITPDALRCHHVIFVAQRPYGQHGGGTHGVTLGADGDHGDLLGGLNQDGFIRNPVADVLHVAGDGERNGLVSPEGDGVGEGAAALRHRHLGGVGVRGEEELEVGAGAPLGVLHEDGEEFLAAEHGGGESWEKQGGRKKGGFFVAVDISPLKIKKKKTKSRKNFASF